MHVHDSEEQSAAGSASKCKKKKVSAWSNAYNSLQIREVFWFVILRLFCKIVVSFPQPLLSSYDTVICAGICVLQVISDLRKSLDLSSCVLPLQILGSQKKLKSQVQARYLSWFTWFSKDKMGQENFGSSLSGLSGTHGYIHEPNLSQVKVLTSLFLPAWC